MKVIFLDFDGVIVTAHDRYNAGDQFAVFNLNRITDETGAKIVVSSTWRMGQTTESLSELLKSWGVTGEVIGRTGDRTFKAAKSAIYIATERGHEIQDWLDEHPEFQKFIILDDDSDMAHLLPFLIKTHAHHGLDETHVTKAIELLESLRGENNGNTLT